MTDFQMPNVFVIPPEEDHSPAWCYFDAAKRNLNLFSLDPALASITASDAPNTAILDAIGHHGSHCVEHDIDYDCEAEVYFEQEEWDYHHLPLHRPLVSAPHNSRQPGDDSDVIEVVKVGRCVLEDEESMQNEQPIEIVHSTTLKSRASKVFHTLKKVGKRRPNKPPPVQDNDAFFPLQAAEPTGTKETSDNCKTPTLPRRSSVLLSQLFITPTGLKSHSSFSHVADHSTSSTPHTTSPLMGSDCMKTRTSLSCEQDFAHGVGPRFTPRAASPSPSFLNKRRFSKINLQKLFSFSTTTSSSASTTSSTISGGLTLSSNDDTALASPSLTSDSDQGQDVIYTENAGNGFLRDDDALVDNANDPVHNTVKVASPLLRDHDSLAAELSLNWGSSDLNLELGLDLGLPTAVYQLNGSIPGGLCRKENGATKRTSSDFSSEMRLDSLHFDDLSFDVNRF